MIDIDQLDAQLELALSEEVRAYIKPLVREPEPTAEPEPTPEPQAAQPPSPRPSPSPALAPESPPEPPPRLVVKAARPPRPRTPTRQFRPILAQTFENTELGTPPAGPAPPPVAPRMRRPLAARSRPSVHQPGPLLNLGPSGPLSGKLGPSGPLSGVRGPTGAPSEDEEGLESHGGRILELMQAGHLAEADRHIAAHAALARDGQPLDRLNAAGWAAMRALLDGRQADARSATDLVLSLGQEAGVQDAADRYWSQRFWVILEWGSDEERFDLLDQCRQRAYWKDDATWRSSLALLLARMGRIEEAQREFDDTAAKALNARPHNQVWLNITTNLAETATYLGDARRVSMVNRAVAWPTSGMVVIGRADVCKGSIARYQALLGASVGRWPEADKNFRLAADAHRRMGARPLLARTLREWGSTLTGRDSVRAQECLAESAALASQLQLVELMSSSS
ncbi:MAG: hypothetical protein ABR540_21575 [Acidimicrobiales bacterium]